MSSGKYSSISVQNVDRQRMKEGLEGDKLVIGLDAAKKDQYGALADETGEVLGVIDWEHPAQSRAFGKLVDELKKRRVQLVMEPTGRYADPLRHLAYERGWEVWRMEPKRVHDAKEVVDGVPSLHDAKAAHLLVWLHGQGLSRRWRPREASRRKVKALTRRLSRLQTQWQRHLGYLEAQMARHWPEILQAWELKRATLLGLLKRYGSPRRMVKNDQEVREFMDQKGGPLLKPGRIDEVLEAARESLGVEMMEAERRALQNLADHTDRLRRDRREFERAIGRLIQREDSLEEVRWIGEEVGMGTAAVFWERMGSFQGYDRPAQLLNGFGLTLKEKSSGKRQSPLHITKRGPSEARGALYLATWRRINSDRWFQAWHRNKLKRDGGKNRADKNVSVVALMRKYVEGLWHVARGREFDSTKLFDTEKLRAA